MNASILIGIAIILIVAAGAGYYFMSSQPQTQITTQSTPTSTQGSTITSATTQTTESNPQTSSSSGTTSETTAATTPAPPATTSTTSTSTTTQPPTETTITSTPQQTTTTATTTSEEETISVKGAGLESLLTHFRKVTLTIIEKNGTTGEVKINNLTYVESKTTLNGEKAIEIDFQVNESNGKVVLAQVWVTPDYKEVLQISIEGHTLTGPMAQAYGHSLMEGLGSMLYVGSSMNMEFVIGTTEAKILASGWSLQGMNPTTVTISGHTYKAYSFKAVNVADEKSNVKMVEGTIANIFGHSYYYTYLKVTMKNNDTYTLKFTELELWS